MILTLIESSICVSPPNLTKCAPIRDKNANRISALTIRYLGLIMAYFQFTIKKTFAADYADKY